MMEHKQAQRGFIPSAVALCYRLYPGAPKLLPAYAAFVSVVLTNRGLFSTAKRRASDGVSGRIEKVYAGGFLVKSIW